MQLDEARKKIIVALDGMTYNEANNVIAELRGQVGGFKVGFELITVQQADLVIEFASYHNVEIFYDGKFHDITQTVANAARRVTSMPSVTMFNVHCSGGLEMMQAAKQAVVEASPRGRSPAVLGVTVLTSHNHESLVEVNLLQPLEPEVLELPDGGERVKAAAIRYLVLKLALLAKKAGLDGVIASPQEIEIIRKNCGPDFLIVTPGVRPVGAALNDQKRVMTPGEAIKAGADYLVIGRPILKPETGTRIEVAQRIVEEIAQAI